MEQLEVETNHSASTAGGSGGNRYPNRGTRSPKNFNDITSNRKSIAIGLLALAVIGATIGIVYMFENSGTQVPQAHRSPRQKRLPQNVRLPSTLLPLEYKLSLIPYLTPAKNFNIDGTVAIDILCREETDQITVHIKKITVKESAVKVVHLDPEHPEGIGPVIPIKSHEYDVERDFYIVVLEQVLEPGSKYRVYIEYIALLSDELVGFYRSSYIDKNTNETRWLGITQFSPTDARRAFPCFDEPALKARFDISLGRLENMTSLSNMNRVRTEPIEGKPGWFWDHYNKTLLMSTYLIGFAVTDFVPREGKANAASGPKFQIWSRKDAANQTDYAASVGPRMLAFFEEYFKIEFPLPKQDIVAVPDMRFSAMENWGLITFRELYILFDPKYSSDAAKQKIIEIVGHEIAHQWFGNLVTPSWWSELWLKEGFASYVEYIGANHVEPEWRILELFLINDFQKVLRMDALNISHPIQVPVDHPDEINQVFDAISYSKGCSLLRMMDHFLTEPTFKQGITNYLNKWKFNSTTQEYLWDALTEQAHADGTLPPELTVGEIMDTWTLQKGFPLVTAARDKLTGNVTLTKAKFNLLRGVDGRGGGYKWWVPISYASPDLNSDFSSTRPSFWMPKDSDTMSVKLDVQENSWYIINVQATGYYRVSYDPENWDRIAKQLLDDLTKINIQNRAQLIDDLFNIARIEPNLYETAFKLTSYIRNEREYLPWNSYVTSIQYLYNVLARTSAFTPLKKYLQAQLRNEYDRLGFIESDSETHLDRAHRVDIIAWACKTDLGDCREKAGRMFADWMNQQPDTSENKIPVNLRRTIYCTAVANGDESVWNFAWNQYLTANVASEKDIILRALTCSKNVPTLQKYLNWSINEGSGVRKQDCRSVIQNIALNEVGNGMVFEFLQSQWTRIKKYLSGGLSIDKIINDGVAQLLTTDKELQQLVNFKNAHVGEFGYGTRAVDEAIEITQINIKWMKDSYEIVSKLLSELV